MDLTRRVDAVLFDKDGTLFDFGATWNAWALKVLDDLSGGSAGRRAAMAEAAGFDLGRGRFFDDSPVIAGTNRDAAECFARGLPGADVDLLERRLAAAALDVPLVEAVPLAPLMARLRAGGLRLGVMTNDTERAARTHLRAVRLERAFDFVAGFDSGHGAKPDPAPLLAFARAVACPPDRVAMVGDSTHDLAAGRAAGMLCLGVLTGPAKTADLARLADAVLPDIGHVPAWLASE